MNTLVDDIGSFPLPSNIERKTFNKAYVTAREAIIKGKDIKENEFLFNNFYRVVIDSFRQKLQTGLDVVTYPQHYDMHMQYADVVHKAMDEGTYIVKEKNAVIPEIHVINQEAKQLCEEIGRRISFRACITGPMELYSREIGTAPYKDILLMFAETVNRFARKSILNTKYIKTDTISIDEPSFGFQDISTDRDTLIDILEKTFNFSGTTKQIHLHSSAAIAKLFEVKNLDVLSFEYAASPKNIEAISRKMLEKADKKIRVGISRTDINSILAEQYEKGVITPNAKQLAENEEIICRRYLQAKQKYGDRITFTGPDCGLGGWPSQEAAQLVLKRTVTAVKLAKTEA